MVIWPEVIPFWRIGIQYYLVGREAFFLGTQPVGANNFHHAVEMFLKAALRKKYTPEQLKSARKPPHFGHNLANLWLAFKALVADPALDSYDDVIAELCAWDEIRYPPEDKDLALTFGLCKGERPEILLDGGRPHQYHLNLESIDQLVAAILTAMSLDLAWVRWEVETHNQGASAYARENRHKLW